MSAEYDILFLAIGDAVTIQSLWHLSISVQKFKDRLDSNGLCIAPVPPAGDEPEVHLANVIGEGRRHVVLIKDHRAHVNRLQDEVERHKDSARRLIESADRNHLNWVNSQSELTKAKEDIAVLVDDNDFHQHRSQYLQRELTEARELLREGLEEFKDGDDWIDRVVAVLTHQPAPAAKDVDHD